MKKITIRDRIKNVANAWANQYPKDGSYGNDPVKQSIAQQLLELDKDTATEQDVENIIGNDSWITIICDVCGDSVEKAVIIGDDDYENTGLDEPSLTVCENCLQHAVETLSA